MSNSEESVRDYTIYAIIGTIFEESIILVALLWVLPIFGIQFPIWLIVLIMTASIAFSYFTYYMGRKALKMKTVNGLDSMIGSIGYVVTPLSPAGYIKIRGEVWKALSDNNLPADKEVIVTAVNGFTLIVIAAADNDSVKPQVQ